MNKINISGKVYLAIEDYAKDKNKTIQTIYNWIKSGKVETKKMFGQQFVRL